MIKIKIPMPGTMEHPNITFLNGSQEECFSFHGDVEWIDEMAEWLFISTKGRFLMLMTSHIYFEREEDAMAFKLKFGSD